MVPEARLHFVGSNRCDVSRRPRHLWSDDIVKRSTDRPTDGHEVWNRIGEWSFLQRSDVGRFERVLSWVFVSQIIKRIRAPIRSTQMLFFSLAMLRRAAESALARWRSAWQTWWLGATKRFSASAFKLKVQTDSHKRFEKNAAREPMNKKA